MGVNGKRFRKRSAPDADEEPEDDEEIRSTLEEVKFLQKQRERRAGVVANQLAQSAGGQNAKVAEKGEGEGEKEELVLQDTFAQETAVTVEDPNMLKYIEQEMAKKRGRELGIVEEAEEVKAPEDDLYVTPDHLKVRRRNGEESSTQWTTGIAEVQLPIEYKLKNIEETEAAKKQLQDKRPFVGRGRTQSSIPASYSADFFQRGREYAEKLRSDHPEVHKNKGGGEGGGRGNPIDTTSETLDVGNGNRRQAATDEIMLERFRKRERSRLMRR
ncbi:hypothetical protein M758_5G054200 [Ceratodon purpureus]|uniref:Hepatocellular carcinoma-associated antigen 59 n=1 Tax=Ceratodon purpureus TaxID=3225 RepID=A0A8T0HZH8_CERPU|nr:hypothetical protein KC19_5G054700 [Ceratodon purpureus]KAG0615596.1 hypothetical protein M758_5G054200 [Ceratodon purpureus]